MKMKNNWTYRLHGAEFKIMRLQEQHPPEYAGDSPDKIEAYLREKIPHSLRYNPDTENLGVIHLSTRRKIIGWEIISNGTLDTLLIHCREFFKSGIITNAAALVAFHNHPSGDSSPSEADIKVTRDLIRAGQLLKIELLDHLILGTSAPDRPKSWSSLRELGFFY